MNQQQDTSYHQEQQVQNQEPKEEGLMSLLKGLFDKIRGKNSRDSMSISAPNLYIAYIR